MGTQGHGFGATRAGALERWQAFLPRAPHYGAWRNRVEPGHPHVSRMSPAIRARLVTTEELVGQLLRGPRPDAVQKLVQELVWRDYWKGWLEWRPGVWTAHRAEVDRWRSGAGAAERGRAEAVMAGRSGVAVMDRFARELVETGYLHNHARIWWAGYWCHVERLPWALGADFFFRHLLDADPASNTLGWRWVAGLQTRGKAYLPRRSNLERHCAPEWIADTRGLERLDDHRVEACTPPPEPPPTRVPWTSMPEFPDLPEGRWGVWIHGEDLTPERSALGRLRPAGIVTADPATAPASHGTSEGRRRWMREALADARRRASAHFRCGVEDRGEVGEPLEHVLVGLGKEWKLDGWVAMRPAVGPLGDVLPGLERALAAAGLEVRWCRRTWDERLWPLAEAGFFPFWEKVRPLLPGWFPPPA